MGDRIAGHSDEIRGHSSHDLTDAVGNGERFRRVHRRRTNCLDRRKPCRYECLELIDATAVGKDASVGSVRRHRRPPRHAQHHD